MARTLHEEFIEFHILLHEAPHVFLKINAPKFEALCSKCLVKGLPLVVHCRFDDALHAGFHNLTAFSDLRDHWKFLSLFPVSGFGHCNLQTLRKFFM